MNAVNALNTSNAAKPASIDYLAEAKRLAPLVDSHAASSEDAGEMSSEVFKALKSGGLYWAMIPQEAGGGGVDLLGALDIWAEIARADASTGWTLMAGSAATAGAYGYVGKDCAEQIFGGKEPRLVGGMFGPGGTARIGAAGIDYQGKFSFGSGCRNAEWFGGGAIVMDGDKPEMGPDGTPRVLICFVPRSKVVVQENWDVMGLRATGSIDYQVPPQTIQSDFTVERIGAKQQRGGPLFAIGMAAIGIAGHTAVAVGIMQRAIEEILNIVTVKGRPGYVGKIRDSAVFQQEFSYHEASYQACKALMISTYAEAQRDLYAGRELTVEQRQRFRQVAIWVHRVAQEVVTFCFNWGGAQSIRNPSALGRCMRDMSVAMQHVLIDPIGMVQAAPSIMDGWRANSAAA
jgi:alkylation response protein AidB-like acyl-CoA dehydrogenase